VVRASGRRRDEAGRLPRDRLEPLLVRVEPLAAFVTAVVTVFNNALAFSIYGFFLPKDRMGAFAMPRSLTIAGSPWIIASFTTSPHVSA